jgi:hypothetical protein
MLVLPMYIFGEPIRSPQGVKTGLAACIAAVPSFMLGIKRSDHTTRT